MAWPDVLSRSLAWTGTGPAFPFQPGREVPDGHCRPIPRAPFPTAAVAHDAGQGGLRSQARNIGAEIVTEGGPLR
jgi:hypothetical protein